MLEYFVERTLLPLLERMRVVCAAFFSFPGSHDLSTTVCIDASLCTYVLRATTVVTNAEKKG